MHKEKIIRDFRYFFWGILNFKNGNNKMKTKPIRSDAIKIGGTELFKTNFAIGKELPWAIIINNKISKCLNGNLTKIKSIV